MQQNLTSLLPTYKDLLHIGTKSQFYKTGQRNPKITLECRLARISERFEKLVDLFLSSTTPWVQLYPI